ncbi:MAG TPA: allantoate amidohydrolase [Actinomycetota bacterium]|jgi:N-carbamoyl-L-amino-acid hydrolase|nr:allantoate amidohydrolase [Actinomycetota bacterium]
MSGNQDRRGAFEHCFGGLAAIGRDPGGGWTRLAWTEEDRAARAWFEAQAADRGLTVERDSAGNLWAWWGGPSTDAGAEGQVVAVGSHLDTVRGGGAYDGALGVVSALLAVGELIMRGVEPRRPLAVVAFADEEGGRFGVPLFGSRVLTGALAPADLLERVDEHGTSVAGALAAAGIDPEGFGPDPARVGRLAAFVELHVEQGRGLADLGQPVALATAMWPHGRWRLTLSGEANHAGTTRLADRRDPMLGLAAAVLAARAAATELEAVATVGRVLVEPNSANSVPERVSAWLDARSGEDQRLDWLLAAFEAAVEDAAGRNGLTAELAGESRSPGVEFDRALTDRLDARLRASGLEPPRLPTAAGHDAGALAAAAVPTAMLFVRNPTGTSHSPAETAEVDDCLVGVEALAAVIEELACR